MAREQRSKAAYQLVDLNDLPKDIRNEVMADAMAGGGEYGVKVVEQSHNGPASSAIFGVYYDVKDSKGEFRKDGNGLEIGNDETKWNNAKKDLGITGSEVEDGEVTGTELDADGRKAAFIRQAAEQAANQRADAIRTAEDEEVRKVLEGDQDADASEQAKAEPNSNIADTTAKVENTAKKSKHAR